MDHEDARPCPVARLTHGPQPDFHAKGEIVRTLGSREDPRVDSLMVVEEFGLPADTMLKGVRDS